MSAPVAAPRVFEGLSALKLPSPDLEDLVRYSTDLHKILEESLTAIADKANFAGQQRYADGRVYRYQPDLGLWISDSRAIYSAGLVSAANSTINTLAEHGVTVTGYMIPQSAVVVRWAWDWIGSSVAGDSCRLLAGGTTLRTSVLGAVSSLSEELLASKLLYAPGEALRFSYSATGTAPQNLVAWVELAWTRTFDA